MTESASAGATRRAMSDTPLWTTDDHASRLAELAARTTDPAKDAPLRRDVRSLGTLLGHVLVEQCGCELFSVVEQLRHLLIQHREHRRQETNLPVSDAAFLQEAREIISRLDVEQAHRVTKAFAIYFELTNLAETNHRNRRRRAGRLRTEDPPVAGSLRGTLLRLRAAGVSASEALTALEQVRVGPVFTAHPTEIARRSVLVKRRRIAEQLAGLDRMPLPPTEEAQHEATILAEITALWQTDEVRLEKPTVMDEVRMGLDYFPISLFETLPRLYGEIAESFQHVYGVSLEDRELPDVVEFGSWIGGDRDGNPFVTPEATQGAIRMAREVVLSHYIHEVGSLADQLSSSLRQANASPELRARSDEYESGIGRGRSRFKRVSASESYRRFLGFVLTRLQTTKETASDPWAYRTPLEFASDLTLMRDSLHANRGSRIARDVD